MMLISALYPNTYCVALKLCFIEGLPLDFDSSEISVSSKVHSNSLQPNIVANVSQKSWRVY